MISFDGLPITARTSCYARLLPFLNRFRPVGFQKTRECTVCEELAVRLAGGAIICLILRMDDALYWIAADRTGLPVSSVDSHAVPECSNVFRKAGPRFSSHTIDPSFQDALSGLEEALNLIISQGTGQLDRREACRVKNFIGVRIADSAEETGIGQRALRVWFSRVSTARNDSRFASNGSIPPIAKWLRARSPLTTCNDARFLLPASVKSSVP